ncbi:uncharacterized protein LOC115695244 [Cannabis sativa]|uniref:uncharacterized protein LOC115695244 n=1 Tax=Cannabis sativa TaxID=3483 RepID=UPI0011DF05F1|nr:uncharacterized protein LOC115695244 [Cannabis sativa]
MKPWDPHENFKKENVKCVPIWIQLEELELKYWGQGTLSKIVSQVGKMVMLDLVTRERERLSYARVMVEVMMDQNFPDFLEFENEFGSTTTVKLKYEWKPVACSHCSGFGHTADECRKHSNGKPQWVIKKDNRKKVETDEEGFVKVTRNKSKTEQNESKVTGKKGASISNSFQISEDNEESLIEQLMENNHETEGIDARKIGKENVMEGLEGS